MSNRPYDASATNQHGSLSSPQGRKNLVMLVALVVAVVLVATAVAAVYEYRSGKASAALADAMRTYDTPIVRPGQPVPPGLKTFPTSEDRAKAANAQFAAIADQYGMTCAGRNAAYLQGVTAMQMGQTATAEGLLKKSADSWNKDIAALAKLALANLYRSSGRDADAISIYQKLAEKPTTTVPDGLAQLQLAELYNNEGKKDQARKIYAQIKDKNPKSAAGELAAQNLGESPSRQ